MILYYCSGREVVHTEVGDGQYFVTFNIERHGQIKRLFSVEQCVALDTSSRLYLAIAVDWQWNYYLIVHSTGSHFMPMKGHEYVNFDSLDYLVDFDEKAEPATSLIEAREKATNYLYELRKVLCGVWGKIGWRKHLGDEWLRHIEAFGRKTFKRPIRKQTLTTCHKLGYT